MRDIDEPLHSSSIHQTTDYKGSLTPNGPPSEPHSGSRPIYKMTLIYNDKEHQVKVLMDTGSSVPVMSFSKARQWKIPIYRRQHPRPMVNFDASVSKQGGRFYSEALVLRHQEDHFTRLNFELTNLDEECDIILPQWWLEQHQPAHFFSQTQGIQFTSEYCKKNCTSKVLMDSLAPSSISAAIQADTQEALRNVPEEFREFYPIMTQEAGQRFPDHQPWDHAIDLYEGKAPPWGPLYAMSERELSTLKPWLEEMINTGKIRKSTSSCAAPMMFVEKADPKDPLRPVVDYRGLNAITVPIRYPIPLITELQARFRTAKFFTKIDLKSGFNLVRIKEGDEWKTAFRCKYGLYEYLVMPFGLINAPATFQAMMNNIFQDLIDAGVLVYLDDILIYGDTQEEHDALVKEVLRRLTKHHLAVSPRKCSWRVQEVEFLGYIIGANGISMSPDKIKSIQEWENPTSLKECQQFVGFANFYRRFIHNFSAIVKPLTDANKGDKKDWRWTEPMLIAFKTLKDRFTTAPVLAHFNPDLIAHVEADASDFAIGSVLSQKDETGKFHPVAFHSRKLNPAEMNYEIHDKELLSIVDSFEKWRQYLEGARHRIEVYSDHQNLSYFTTAKVLNRRQARWAQQLASYWFIINYRPGRLNEKADILSRLPQYRPEKGGAEDQPITSVLQEKHFSHSQGTMFTASAAVLLTSERLCSLRTPRWSPEFVKNLRKAASEDPVYLEQKNQPGKDIEIQDDLLYRKNRLWVPIALQREIMESEHDTRIAGHMGMDKTMELVTRNFWWPNLEDTVREYVRGCLECQRNKIPRHAPHGLLQPMELHYKPWHTIAMDFITDLPLSNGCDSIWVIVDPFTKMAHFIPLKVEGKKTDDLIKIFAKEYWRLHGVPLDIISDRDSRFTAHLWKDFLKLVGIKSRMSTAFHPQTDGQTERLNQTLEAYLRSFVNYEMDNWEDLLPTAEFAYNNTVSSSSHMTPFYANYGYHPATHNPSLGTPKNPGSRLYSHWMTQVQEDARKHLEQSRHRMKTWADKKRVENPEYTEGQLVMLNAKNVKTRRPAKKLDQKMLGPFKIQKVISPTAVRLTLPKGWRIHNSFHVSLIEPYRAGNQALPDPDQVLREAAPIEAEDYQVEEVKDSVENLGKVKYLIKWEGWPAKRHWTWEPYDHLFSEGAKYLVKNFHQQQPGKPTDPRVYEAAPRDEA